jgi:hypothetical protein
VWDDPTLFITKPGHDFPETETVVSKTDGWARAPRICGQSSSRSSTSARRATLTAGHNRWARAPHSLGVDRAEPPFGIRRDYQGVNTFRRMIAVWRSGSSVRLGTSLCCVR